MDQENPVYTLYTLYTERIQGGMCEEEVRKTRVLSMRVSRLAKRIYDFLPDTDKDIIKAITEGAILAAALKRFERVPCRVLVERKVAFALSQGPQVSLTFNVNYTRVETKVEANQQVNVNIEVINEIKEVAEKLFRLRSGVPPVQRREIERLYRLAQKLN